MIQPGRILVVDDNSDILTASRLLLKQHYTVVQTSDDPSRIMELLKEPGFDVLLLDMNFARDATSGREGLHWLRQALSCDPNIVVIMMTAFADISLSVEAIKAGATDFIAKPCSNEHLLASLASAFRHVESKKEIDKLRQENRGLSHLLEGTAHPFIGESAAMRRVFNAIEKVARTDANVLLSGESGTGKGLAAQALHRSSTRANGAFVTLDIGSLTSSLFESEFFGYRKGAFTDAKTDRVGRFELANNGTMFLDELGNLPLVQQAKLLSALQTGEITPVGGNQAVKTNVRLICASNENLHQAVAEGRFRQDLLYRINTVEITLPPLRERVEDIPLLLDYYLGHFCRKYRVDRRIDPDDLEHLLKYRWPGNVRELAHSMERAVILADDTRIDIGTITSNRRETTASMACAAQGSNTEDARATFDLELVEEQTIHRAVKHFHGNMSQAAKALGISRGALYRRLEKYGL
ncbi:MAG: sigma-54-dependent Fis family transcriptional regulator [Xanthomonadaceae bacterium]|nr:sigma-54-dependent Fis family transcriptional regulator [Xanthomonadaceae bacterium]